MGFSTSRLNVMRFNTATRNRIITAVINARLSKVTHLTWWFFGIEKCISNLWCSAMQTGGRGFLRNVGTLRSGHVALLHAMYNLHAFFLLSGESLLSGPNC
jgi:hypothetical protein